MGLKEAQELGNAPLWMTEAGYITLQSGYLLDGETPKDLYTRVANRAAELLKDDSFAAKLFNALWKGWLGLASPVASNFGAKRGLPISCYGSFMQDSIDGIFGNIKEIAHLSAKGGGTSVHISDIRPKHSAISDGGTSKGVIPWCKIIDSTIIAVNQSNIRRGSVATYLHIDHPDFPDFLKMRRPIGEIDLRCLNIHHGAVITDDFMKRVKSGDKEARDLWFEILTTRIETGEPYLFFYDTVNRLSPQMYKDKGLTVNGSNLCSEIMLHTSELYTFVCCLSSVNLAKYNEWKDTDLIETAIFFLDAVIEEFIIKTEHLIGFEKTRNFAIKSRALGLGVVGFHTYLQQESMPMGSIEARKFNLSFFKEFDKQTRAASEKLATIYGEPEWCSGYGVRNTHTSAIAPTVSNSVICGEVSPGIDPRTSNCYSFATKTLFNYKNLVLQPVLAKYGKDTPEIWENINETNGGSVQHLDFLSDHEKEVFKTAREIDQLDLVYLAADRTQYIDQGQSVNLFFDPENTTMTKNELKNYINKVHFKAWELGVKTLYYCRATNSQQVAKVGQKNEEEILKINEPKDTVEEFTTCELKLTGPTPCAVCDG
jgi:ribonucleoside-diphosphate reductase alpha chain